MEQKMRAPKLSIWLLAALVAAVVASAQGWTVRPNEQFQTQQPNSYTGIPYDRSTYKGCVQQCGKSNSLFSNGQDKPSAFFRLSGLFRKTRSLDESDQTSVQFEQGKTYSYRVSTWNEARAIFDSQGQDDQDDLNTKDQLIQVQATALFTPISDCELSMQLKNIDINLNNDNQEEAKKWELLQQLQVPILFAYKDGVVSEVCTDSEEDTFALNLKKSIISALQTTPRLENTERVKVIESDFHGECETEYSIEKQSSDKFQVRKRKNLAKCDNAAEQAHSYSNWQSALLKHSAEPKPATVKCEQQIILRQIKSAECESARLINTVMPHYSLELVSKVELQAEQVMPAEQVSARVPQRFSRHAHRLMMTRPEHNFGGHMKNHHQDQEQLRDGRVQLQNVLDQICENIQQNGRRPSTKTVQYVHTLADTLRRSSQEDVQFIWKNVVQNGAICGEQAKKVKDIFVDTAASVMDRESAQIVRDELIKYIEQAQQSQSASVLNRAKTLAFLVSFAYEPTPEAVREIVPELIEKTDNAQIILSLTSLVKKTRDQLKTELTTSLYETVLRKVFDLLSKDINENEVDIIRLFAALENIEPQSEVSGQDRLAKLAADSRLPTSVRIAAIKSFEQIEMEPKLRQALLQIIAQQSEKNEVRIVAYRTIVMSDVTVSELKQILAVVEREKEQNQDVFNYIASHQKNLRTTDDLKKRSLLPLEAPVFPEPQSLANFALSRNFDYTTINPKTQVGAIVEADLIMEKESRVPKSVTFNLTVPVAHQQLPIVEVTIRQQGLERSIMERLEMIKQLKSPRVMLRELTNWVRSEQQSRRQNNDNKEAKIQMMLNIDGKNVFVWDSQEKAEKENEEIEFVMAHLYKFLPLNIDETNVMMPLKYQVRLPTSSGIPVNFELNTTIIASLESTMKGAQQKQSGDSVLEMHIKPTFVVEVGVGLSADIDFLRQPKRVQFVNRFISAPTLHMKTQIKENERKFNVKVFMPEDEQIVARFETEFNNDKDDQIELLNSISSSGLKRQIRKALNKRQQQWYRASSGRSGQKEQCLPVLDQLMGFTYCVERYSMEDLKQSLASKQARKMIYQSQIKLVKTDRQMEGIEFGMELPVLSSETEEEVKFVLHYDTPNSKVNRRFNTELTVRQSPQSKDKFGLELEIDTPVKKISGQVMLINTEQQKAVKIELLTDGQQRQFLLDANVLVAVQDAQNTQVKLQLRLQPSAHCKLSEFDGQLTVQAQSEQKKKVELKLLANEKEVLNVDFVKVGSLFRAEENLKMSGQVKVNFLGLVMESSALLAKDQSTGTIKSSGQIKYNRFLAFARAARNSDEETAVYQFQYTGYNQPIFQAGDVKKFIHWTLQSSQFPRLNQELTYNIQGQLPEQFSQEFTFKWDSQRSTDKRVHIVHESKQLQNARARSVKHQSQVEIEITPLNVHYDTQLILDLAREQEPQQYDVELKATNRKTQEVAVEGRATLSHTTRKPVQFEAQAELKIRNGQYVIRIQDTVQEVSQGFYKGKTVIEVPEQLPGKLGRFVPKKFVRTASYKKLDNPVERIPEISGRKIQNFIAKVINHLGQVEQEIVIDCEQHGKIRFHSVVVSNEQNEWQVKSELERNQQSIYKAQAEIEPAQRALKVKFEAEKLDQLQVEIETQLKGEQKKFDIKVENRRMQHATRIQADKQEKKLELTCMTKKNQQVVFEIDAKKQNKLVQLKIKSRLVEAEIELDNVANRRFVRSMMMKKRSTVYGDDQQEDSQAKIFVKLPTKELEHKTELQVKPAQRQIVLTTETRKEERNLFKAQIRAQPEEKSIEAEYKKGYIAKVKLVKQQNGEYEFNADYRVEAKQWIHQSQAKWQFQSNQNSARKWISPAQFRLISLEMKNHLGPRNVFDLTYKCNEQNPSAEYAHQFFVSTRDSHAELHCSRLTEQAEPKILFTLKSKKFGGIEHKTEIKNVSSERRSAQLFSSTVRAGELIAQVECELALKRGQQSRVKVQLVNGHKVELQFVPFQSLEAQAEYADSWKHQIKVDRQARQRQWTVKVESLNKRNNDKWNVQLRHQCDQFTTVEIESPVVRGNVEVRLDESKKVHIDLKGAGKYAELEHKTDAALDWDSKKVVVKSVTVKEGGKPVVFVDAELYASTERTSTLKVEVEPLEFKSAIECDPKVGGELKFTIKQWKHQMQIKKRSAELQLHSETRKDGEVIVLIETELTPRKVDLKCELALKKYAPITLKGKFDIDAREMHFQAHNKRSDRKVKLEAKMRDMSNIHFEFAWDLARDQSKQVLVQIAVQDKETAPQRFVASIRGDIVDRPFEVKIDVPRVTPRPGQWIAGSHHIEAELKNRKTNDQYIVKYIRKYEPAQQYESWIEARKNDFTALKTNLKVQLRDENKKVVELKMESDFKSDALNVELTLNRECAYKQCETKAQAVYGYDESQKTQVKFEGANVADAIRGQLVIDSPRKFRAQTLKFEYIKPESKLQLNVFNQSGRQLDLNIDLARPLQKKFQIESFIESIPTVDIETALGENSRVVIAVSFQQEKKMELALNWFGQWRRDFKLEALFKCFSKPSVEMLITSRHPEGVDEFDAMLKVAAKEYVAKWTRKFDDKKNWNTKTLIQVNGEKKVDLKVACETKEVANRRVIKTLKAQLDGVKRATGQVTMAIRDHSDAKYGMIELVQAELVNHKQERVVVFDLYLGVQDNQSSSIQTGVKLASKEKTIFGLVHYTSDRVSADNKRTSMVRLELPDQIEYVLRNEIEYESRSADEIKSIRSELKKAQQTIYKTRIVFADDHREDMKVMRVEVHSAQYKSPKIIEIRYNFEPKQCKTLTIHEQDKQKEQKKRTFNFGQTECWQVEILAGSAEEKQNLEQFEADKQYDIKIGAQYLKYPIDGRHFNRTIRFTVQSGDNQNEEQTQLINPIDFTMVGHISCRSAGLVWDNHNRHGQHKSGMTHFEVERLDSGRNMVHVHLRNQNRRQPSKDLVYDLHFQPSEMRKTVRMNAKWDQERVRRWIVGQMPELEQMIKDKSMSSMKSRMMREIRDEFRHKMAYLADNYNNELAAPIMNEIEQVQKQMWQSENRIAQAVSKIAKRATEKVEEMYESINVEQSLAELTDALIEAFQQAKREAVQLVAKKCQKSKSCRQLVDQIRDYEIEKFVQEQIVERAEKLNEGLKRAIPSDLLESVKDLAKQFNKAHKEDDDDQEEQDEDNEQQKETEKKRRWVRHGARLLKMSQPEMSETIMMHMNKIAKKFNKRQQEQDFDDEFDYSQNQNQQQQKKWSQKSQDSDNVKIDWPEVRGALHDMAVDVVDRMQEKMHQTQQQQEVQPFWSKFMGGSQAGKGQQKQMGDYTAYASKYQNSWKNANKTSQDDQDDDDDSASSKDNFVFSPKRGEFKWFDNKAQKASSWTRA